MAEEEIYIDWEPGPPMVGQVQIVDDGPFEGVVLVREPSRHGLREPVRVYESDDELRDAAGWWPPIIDEDPEYKEYRQAMADWWSAVVLWVAEQREADRG